MHVLHIGSLRSQHSQIAAIAYRELGYSATFLNTSHGFAPTEVPGVSDSGVVFSPWAERHRSSKRTTIATGIMSLMRYSALLPDDNNLVHAVQRIADRYPCDVIVGSWGLPVLDATLVAQRILFNRPHIHYILTFPELPVIETSLRGTLWRIYAFVYRHFKLAAYQSMLANCDLRIHCSDAMLRFMQGHLSLGKPGKDIVKITHYPRVFFPKVRFPKLSQHDGESHIIHIGATNLSGGRLDDLSEQFARLAARKIHVHYHATDQPTTYSNANRRYLHVYDRFPYAPINGALAEYMSRFDLALVLYNVKHTYQRFINSLPDRFLYSLIAGIPIGVPKGLFPACEEYILKHNIGVAYHSELELLETLSDKETMKSLDENAQLHSNHLSLEDHLTHYESLFSQAIAIRRARYSSRQDF